MTKDEAKKFVIDTILTGDSKMIARVVKRYQEVYGEKRNRIPEKPIQQASVDDRVRVAEEIGLTEK